MFSTAWLIILALLSGSVNGSNNSRYLFEENLKKNVFKDYKPILVSSKKVTVDINVTLHQLKDFNEREEIITIIFWLRMGWFDDFLVWNPDDYGGIKTFRSYPDKIWVPTEITIFEDVLEEDGLVGVLNPLIRYDGRVETAYNKIVKSFCSMKLRYFPYDRQVCQSNIGTVTLVGNNIEVRNASPGAFMQMIVPHCEWIILEAPVVKNKRSPVLGLHFSVVTYDFIFQRRADFYLYNLVLPSCVITFISVFSFLLPPNSEEKITLGVTTLLGLVVVLLLVTQTLPAQSEEISLLAEYFIGTIILLSMSTCTSVLIIHVYHRGDILERMPRFLRVFAFEYLSRALFMQLEVLAMRKDIAVLRANHKKANDSRTTALCGWMNISDNFSDPKDYNKTSSLAFPTHLRSLTRLYTSNVATSELTTILHKILGKVSVFENIQLEHERLHIIACEWRLLAYIANRLFFILYACFAVIMSLMMQPPRDYKKIMDLSEP